MKSLLYIALFFLFILTSCTKHDTFSPIFTSIDSLIESRPDSALKLIESINPQQINTMPDYAYYILLLTQARDKNFIIQKDDSLIQTAIKYFNKRHNTALQARAYYLLGSVYRDMKEPVHAVENYSKAIMYARQSNNHVLLGRAYNQLGFMYYLQSWYTKADSIYKNVEAIGRMLNDSNLYAEAIYMQGKIQMRQLNYPQAENRLITALEISKQISHRELQADMTQALALLYSYMGNNRKSLEYANQSLQLQEDTAHCYTTYLTLGESYYQNEKYDSASICFKKAFLSPHFGTKSDASMRLADIAQKQGNIALSLKMERMHSLYADSMAQSLQHEKLLDMEKNAIVRTQQKQIKDQYNQLLYCILLCTAIFFALNSTILYKWFKKQISDSRKTISKYPDSNMEPHSCESPASPNILHTEAYQKINRILSAYKEKKTPKEFLTDDDWNELKSYLDKNEIVANWSKTYKLTTIEFHLCILLLLDFSAKDRGRLLQRERNTIYRLERSISEKIQIEYQANNLQKHLRNMLHNIENNI